MAGGQISLAKAYLVAIWLETLFYGANVCLFASYVYIVRFRRVRKLSPFLFWGAVLMFCFSTVHVSLGLARLIWGFVDDLGGAGAAAYFSDVSQPPNVAKVTIHTVNSILGDTIVVWRCWHVWARDFRVCIAPALLIVASAICGFGQAYIFATAKTTHSAFASTLARWNGSLFVLSLVTNVVVTALIVTRIWFIMRDTVLSNTTFRYIKIFIVVIESAMIYSTAVLIEIILYFSGNNAFYIVYDPIAQLTGIVPTTIIIISTLGLTAEDIQADATAASRGEQKRPKDARFQATLSSMRFGSVATTTTATALTDLEARHPQPVSGLDVSVTEEDLKGDARRLEGGLEYGYELGVRPEGSSSTVWK